MKKLSGFLLLAATIVLGSCQSEEIFDDNASNSTVQNPKEGVFRVYPTGTTTRSSNAIYIDLEPDDRKVYYNIQSSSYTPQQIEANYKIEFFVSENFDWLSNAFKYIENSPRTNTPGKLYWLHEQNGDYFPYRPSGYKAEYYFAKITPIRWCLNMYKIFENDLPNVYYSYTLPTRIKITHKMGGPSFVYDIIQTGGSVGGSPMSWRFSIP